MNVNSPVIAGIDFSPASSVVLDHAAKVALAGGRRLIAAHVLDDSKLKAWAEATGRQAGTDQAQAEARSRLEALVKAQESLLPIEIDVPVGRPFAKLTELVKQNEAGLLVLNAHDFSKKRLGSVASKCVRTVPADVLLLRDWQGGHFKKVLACVDFSETCAMALERAIDLAAAHGASLEILHVLFPPSRDPWGKVIDQPMTTELEYEENVRRGAQARLDGFLAPFAERLEKVTWCTELLESEDPGAAIAAHVVSDMIDVTVLGTQGRTWLGGLVLGSTAERLMQDSPTSILLVRLDG